MPELRKLCAGAALFSMPNAEALALAAALADDPPEGFLDAVPGARTLLLLYDPDVLDPERLRLPRPSEAPRSRVVRLQARYDGADLEEVARELGISREAVVRRHVQAEHVVSFLGFAPGFAYMTGGFALPRLRTPRVRVPAGSLAVADGYTGIYPAETPGGWRLLGHVAARMFDPSASPPALLRPGDRVVFEPVEHLGETAQPPPLQAVSGAPLLRVIAPGAFTSVQGGPRYGLLSSGVPAGGAMDLGALAAANRAAGNAPLAPALEITLAGPELEALEDVRVALGSDVRELARGEHLQTGPVRRGVRAYLAVEGGLSPPLPGEPTRPLRRGELLHGASAAAHRGARPPGVPTRWGEPLIEVRAHRGPQWDFFASPEDFFDREYRVSPSSDRRGLRLQGPALALGRRSDIPPEGTAPGAVQVPGDGLPIVLGPDRPVTGGYAKIATVVPADFPLLAQARPGTAVRVRGGAMDLNADLGEGMDDGPILPFLTSANVACGMHAGGPLVMERTVAQALSRGVRVGAHPGYPDRENFGRTAMDLPLDEVRALVLYQVGALDAFVRSRGGRLTHVKAHGALYNRAARDAALARAIAEAVHAYGRDLILVGLAGSAQLAEARALGLRSVGEAFADRRYLPDGSLMPRSQPGSVLHDGAEAAEQALRIARDRSVVASDGSRLRVDAETLCLHGDTPGAVAIARAVRERLESSGVPVAPP